MHIYICIYRLGGLLIRTLGGLALPRGGALDCLGGAVYIHPSIHPSILAG